MTEATSSQRRRALGVFSVAMITAGSVDSIRNLPATALFGSSLIFFFLLAALLFLLPGALVSAELASNNKNNGGVYVWIKEAFGERTGFLAIWFQWIENVIWYPAILSFVAGTFGYLIAPSLINNKIFLVTVILLSFWGMTFLNLFGIKSSARFSNFCALTGLILPMILIISLGVAWLFSGHHAQIHFTKETLLPHFSDTGVWVSLTGIILSFCGVEIATVHSNDVNQPQKTYPRAMLIAVFIIVFTLLCGALSIAMVLPSSKISLVAGIMQAFNAFFSSYHLHWILPLIALMLVIGSMGCVNNWIIAPTRGLLIAVKDNKILPHLQSENRFGAPMILLVYQAIIVSVISLVFLLMPSVNGSYWLLTALAAQLYMLMYVLMFLAAIRLRKTQSDNNGFRIPFKRFGLYGVCFLGIIGCVLTFVIGFIPPENIQIGSDWNYELLLLLGLVIMILFPFILHWYYQRKLDSSILAENLERRARQQAR